ncbi:protein kinase, partial [Myxococcota bacterium]|nr:protein kinase [Myxococcota bacterium]
MTAPRAPAQAALPPPAQPAPMIDAPQDDRLTPSPAVLGDYVVVARLGGGGMADVFLAHKMSRFGFVRRAVIKRVRRSRPGFKNLQRMLLDEAHATALFDHPNIVSLLDVGEDESGVYLALEYVDGTDLRWVNTKLRQRKEALPFELACYITIEVLRGLHHAHTIQGPDGRLLEIVHRDVNPANVLVSYSGHVKLADFGVVRMRDRVQNDTEAGLVKGKYAYLAPEYIAGESCTLLSDVYAAGIMLFELLSGRECFTGNTTYEVMWKIVNRGVPMYRLEREGVPEDLCRLVQRATNPVPERRFSSAQEMANALETWLMKNQRHATPWVLSVFFQRHQLFPSHEEKAAQNIVPAIARSVHAIQQPAETPSQWSEPTPFHTQQAPAHRDVVVSETPLPELEAYYPPHPEHPPHLRDPMELGGYDPSAGDLRRRAPTDVPGRAATVPPSAAMAMAVDVDRAIAEGVHIQFPQEAADAQRGLASQGHERAPPREPEESRTLPAISWPEDARQRPSDWGARPSSTPVDRGAQLIAPDLPTAVMGQPPLLPRTPSLSSSPDFGAGRTPSATPMPQRLDSWSPSSSAPSVSPPSNAPASVSQPGAAPSISASGFASATTNPGFVPPPGLAGAAAPPGLAPSISSPGHTP